ncbi:tetratricopeptide repeat protein [Cohnella sp. REN36]|uniref:tetratricopeptide repeat protein n=1 Tax=Cohnella sp. REN36 TaxID=2887347 RepID=UPI001D153A0F|nr:tetratricopeptide repeat protein [Cohnella sp. REN36]MCC3375759.1 tetratricopeptide repeat protein [Cohnella sp. REN36]
MFVKALLFFLLWRVLGNPFLAILVLLVVFYFLERRYIGLTPSLVKPFKRRGAIGKARRQLLLNPHDVSAQSELARLLIESKRFRDARDVLLDIEAKMEHSAEYWSDRGIAELAIGHTEEGERAMNRALEISPRVKYGLPYLKLGEAYAKTDADKAIGFLQEFQRMNASSCEAFYRLGTVYRTMGRTEEAREAYRACRELYRTLPRYMRRKERKWALLAAFAKA